MYDIDVEYDVLCSIEDKLRKIEYDIEGSTERMSDAIRRSQDFLAGRQFEKAKETTKACVELTGRTRQNISYAREYIVKLQDLIDEYSKYTYSGD